MAQVIRFLVFYIATGIQASGPYFFVLSPNVIRYGHEEEIVISVLDKERTRVSFHLEIHNGESVRTFAQKTVFVEQGQPVTEKITVGPQDVTYQNEKDKPRTVTVVASADFASEQRTEVLLDYKSGYIFIQTDKPIYYPRDKVTVRTLALTEGFKELSNNTITIDVINPENVIMKRETHTYNGSGSPFCTFDYHMLINPPTGTWRIRALFAGQYETEKISSFQVEVYKLPTFGVSVTAEKLFILPHQQDDIKIEISAVYIYGKPVGGDASLELFLAEANSSNEKSLISVPTSKMLQCGETSFNIAIEDLKSAMENNWFPHGQHLVIKANVTEEVTGNQESSISQPILFTRTEHRFSFSRSRQYYYISSSYDLRVRIKHVNGTVVKNLPIKIQCVGCLEQYVTGSTNDRGQATYTFQAKFCYEDILRFKVFVVGNSDESKWFEVNPHQATTHNKIGLDIDTSRKIPKIMLHANVEDKDNYTGIVSMFISRGKPMFVSYNDMASDFPFEIEPENLETANPSTRCTVFYVDRSTDEVVADSARIPLANNCQMTLNVDETKKRPGQKGTISVQGSEYMRVGLTLMDKALLFRNNENVLTSSTLSRELDSHDLGCGQGGGTNSSSVFQNAGLAILTNANLHTVRRRTTGCSTSSTIEDYFTQDDEGGDESNGNGGDFSHISPLSGYNGQTTISGHCDTIQHWTNRSNQGPEPANDCKNAISGNEERTNFVESWYFNEFVLGIDGTSGDLPFRFPHSVTEWVVSAVGISPGNYLCVADPVNVTTFQDFFMQLYKPYDAVQLKTTDIKVAVFNYRSNDEGTRTVQIYMHGEDGVCSGAEEDVYLQQKELVLPPNSADSVLFQVAPQKVGTSEEHKLNIIIKAADVMLFKTGSYDTVRDVLFVKNEGSLEKIEIQVCLDPLQQVGDFVNNTDRVTVEYGVDQGKVSQVITIDLTPPANAVDGTAYAYAMITGVNVITDVIKEYGTVLRCIHNNVVVPIGSSETVIMRLSGHVYAMNFLQKVHEITTQMADERRALIINGVQRLLNYKKSDGSFSIWPAYPASTWLTAFTIKVFCQTTLTVPNAVIFEQHVSPGYGWLWGKKADDGSFPELYRIFHKSVLGLQTLLDPSMTAYVLITLLECKRHREVFQSDATPDRTVNFLEGVELQSLSDYEVCIISYALALAKSSKRLEFKEELKRRIHTSPDNKMVYWGNTDSGSTSFGAMESTAYALLALLEFDDLELTTKAVRWLVSQWDSKISFTGNGVQVVVVGLQALAEYYQRIVNLGVKIGSFEANVLPENAEVPLHVRNAFKYINDDKKLIIEVSGHGRGLLNLELAYNRRSTENDSKK